MIILSHQSALEYWRRRRRLGDDCLPASARLNQLPKGAPSLAEIRTNHADLHNEGHSIHVMVGSSSDVRRREGICVHRCAGALPRQSLMRLAKDFYTASPELAFMQCAIASETEDAIRLGYELCSTFSLVDDDIDLRGFIASQPLTNTANLRRYVQSLGGRHGAKRAREALRYILDGAASPREVATAMLLTLPMKRGGYGLPAPVLNGRIELTSSQQKSLGVQFCRADMLWPAKKVALEYDSDQWHAGVERLTRDSRRRNHLKAAGYEVVSLTNAELRSPQDMDRIAGSLSRLLGKRLRVTVEGYEGRKRNLRARLLASKGSNL